jgi:hypothetical protein
MEHETLRERVRELRSKGSTPKAIARTLGVSQATVKPILRDFAIEQAENEPSSEVIQCLVSAGWSSGLILESEDWPDSGGFSPSEGLTAVLVIRRDRRGRLSVCGFLLDVFCLGVKDVLGPKRIDDDAVRSFVAQYFSAFEAPPVPISIEQASELVHGAVTYARELGFEPRGNFASAAAHLTDDTGKCSVTFGRQGKPFYISGPHDNSSRVMATLQRNAGDGNFEFVAELTP